MQICINGKLFKITSKNLNRFQNFSTHYLVYKLTTEYTFHLLLLHATNMQRQGSIFSCVYKDLDKLTNIMITLNF